MVKLSRVKFHSMKITHPEAKDMSALRIQKLLIKLSLKIMTKNIFKQWSSNQNQRQNLENNIITFLLRTFLMNGQRLRSKYVLVFSVKFPPSLWQSKKMINMQLFATVMPHKQISNMDQNVLKKPPKKWTDNKLVIKFFTSNPLLRRASVRKNFITRV